MELHVRHRRIGAAILALLLVSRAAWAAEDLQGDNMVRVGGDVTVAEGRVVHDAVAVGGSITVLSGGRVMHNAVAGGGDVSLKANARVEGDAVSIGGEILKEAGANVGGSEVIIASGAKEVVEAVNRWGLRGLLYRAYLASLLLHLLVAVILAVIGVVLLLLLPGPLQIIAATIQQSALKSGAWGVGGILASFLVLTLTTGSLLGAVLAPVLLVALMVVGVVGGVGIGLFVGERMTTESDRSQLSRFLLGMLLLGLFGLAPVVGGLILVVANLFGCGAVLVSRFGHVQSQTVG